MFKNILRYSLEKIVFCQKLIRGFLDRNKNIYYKLKNQKIHTKFQTEILGYHMVNSEPVKESTWEEINCNILKDFCKVSDEAKGKHSSGKDNRFDNWNISNKTGKIESQNIKISSYRLTTVCNDKEPGKIEEIISEIEKRDKSFHYYSILLRKEGDHMTSYYWYIIPKDYYPFNPRKQEWKEKVGVKGKKRGGIVGWECDYMEIIFSMSSQLWYKFRLEEIEKYLICKVDVDEGDLEKITYSDIYLRSSFVVV